jgi:hypothetical protein
MCSRLSDDDCSEGDDVMTDEYTGLNFGFLLKRFSCVGIIYYCWILQLD